jgi:hypothetical protein
MNSLATFAVRRAATGSKTFAQHARLSSTIPIDDDHYSSGWNIQDIDEFTQTGKYQIQTYNKISEKVRRKLTMFRIWHSLHTRVRVGFNN